ncbi:MAG: peptidylprolyl isomerase [Gammaproteobacteria bacterium]|nr:peptidylprolyl isomerase [Gammaproteobacteria bacterium]HBW82715.1 peptidylprolyl isomerase [Gammaproteobacteria bacterium]
MKRIALACLAFLSISVNAQPLVAVIETERGVMKAELNDRAAPTTVANFVNLALRGFYDGLSFHRVERNFMAQGGDPRADGTGGPGYQFAGELLLKHNRQGVLSMANSGPGTDGSQFFITHLATPHLDGKHSVFGRVIDGLQTVLQIRRRDKIQSITIEGDPTELFRRRERQLVEWNAVLDQRFPELRAAFLPR